MTELEAFDDDNTYCRKIIKSLVPGIKCCLLETSSSFLEGMNEATSGGYDGISFDFSYSYSWED